jgi:peptide/nickel transport system permease protein
MGFVLTFLARRLSQGVLIVVLVSFAIFALLRLVPGDPARMILGPMASDAAVEKAAAEMGLREPIPVQYLYWVGKVVRGDLGTSFAKGEGGQSAAQGNQSEAGPQHAHVSGLILKALPMTLQLGALALVFCALISVPLGIAAGLYTGRWLDKLALYLGSVFVSLPNFWVALILALVLTAQLNLVPSIGYEGFAYTILPAVVIAIEISPIFMRAISISIADVRRQNFVALGALRGFSPTRVFFAHIVRNAAPPMLNLFGVQIGALLGGVLVVEYIFNYPGIGLLTVQAVAQRDFPVIQGIAILSAVIFVVVNIVVDLVSSKIDPRLEF